MFEKQISALYVRTILSSLLQLETDRRLGLRFCSGKRELIEGDEEEKEEDSARDEAASFFPYSSQHALTFVPQVKHKQKYFFSGKDTSYEEEIRDELPALLFIIQPGFIRTRIDYVRILKELDYGKLDYTFPSLSCFPLSLNSYIATPE